MDYKQLGLEILLQVGGKDNVSKLTHCATRLRMEFNDDSKVQAKAIESLPRVISVVASFRSWSATTCSKPSARCKKKSAISVAVRVRKIPRRGAG